MSESTRMQRLEAALRQALAPDELTVQDDGHLHVGHAGARQGGHFTVFIRAAAFSGVPLRERHRMVYAAVDDLMRGDIHALSIKAKAPDER